MAIKLLDRGEREGAMDGGVCEVKITPLRPVAGGRAALVAGSKEWFEKKCLTPQNVVSVPTNASPMSNLPNSSSGSDAESLLGTSLSQRKSSDPTSSSFNGFSTMSSIGSMSVLRSSSTLHSPKASASQRARKVEATSAPSSELDSDSFDTFVFTLPLSSYTEDRRSSVSGDNRRMVEKNLRITQLKVATSFPTAVSRLPVISRTVNLVSPLQQNVSTVCSWNSIMFQTILATSNLTVHNDGEFLGYGIGKEAAKILVDALHQSRICSMAVKVLSSKSLYSQRSNRKLEILNEEEIVQLKCQLSRGIVMFLELLHTLLVKNRELLLDWVAQRKLRAEEDRDTFNSNSNHRSFSHNFGQGIMPKFSASHMHRSHHGSHHSGTYSGTHGTLGSTSSKRSMDEAEANNCNPGEEDMENRGEDGTGRVTLAPGEQLKSAIGVQSELQRSFSSTTRALYPLLTSWLGEEEVPSWIAMSSADGYFASSSYASVQMSHSIHFMKAEWGSQ